MINSYLVLERIGRSREHGEVTQGKHGLSRLNMPCKSAFYFRKRLLADGLIVKQPMSMKVSNRMTLGTLLHLPRFYCLRQSKLIIMMKKLIQVLKVSLFYCIILYNSHNLLFFLYSIYKIIPQVCCFYVLLIGGVNLDFWFYYFLERLKDRVRGN